jgi:hypothetical protein
MLGNTLFSQEHCMKLRNPRERTDSAAIEDWLTVIGLTVIT